MRRGRCGACRSKMVPEVHDTTKRLLKSLDLARRSLLAATYQGKPPRVLCAPCFLATTTVLNAGVRQEVA